VVELTDAPVLLADSYSGSSGDYVKLLEWQVGRQWGGRRGNLKEIRIACADYTAPRFRLVLRTHVQRYQPFEDLKLEGPLVASFPSNNLLARNDRVTLEVKSSDGSSISVHASITGSEEV